MICREAMPVPPTTTGDGRTESWVGERPPERVITEWVESRERLGRAYPNNDPDRFFSTAAAIDGAKSVVVRTVLAGGETGFLLGRIADRRDRVRIGFTSVPGMRMRTIDVVRGGVLTPLGSERAFVQSVVGTLWAQGAKKIVWHAIPGESGMIESVRALGRCVVAASEERYILRMQPDSKHPLAHRSAKSRSKIRRYDRLFKDRFPGAVMLERITKSEQVRDFCAACEAISRHSYHAEIGYGVRDGEPWWSMLTATAISGDLRSYLLLCGDDPVAYQNGSLIGDTYYSDGKGFDRRYQEHRPGTVLLHRMLMELHAEGVRCVDYGVGESEYKDVFSNVHASEYRLASYGPGVAGACGAGAATLSRFIVSVANALSTTRVGRRIRTWKVHTSTNVAEEMT